MGILPSASVGWVISNEKFMQNITPINYLKFRASIGTLGNERIEIILIRHTFRSIMPLCMTVQVLRPNLRCLPLNRIMRMRISIGRKHRAWDIGVDAAFFNNRLDFSADYYYKKTTDMLLSVAIRRLQVIRHLTGT